MTEAPSNAAEQEASSLKTLPLFLMCFFVGFLGIHRFYAGKPVTGVIQLLTLGGLGIWAFIDLILIVCGVFKDKEGKPIKNWN